MMKRVFATVLLALAGMVCSGLALAQGSASDCLPLRSSSSVVRMCMKAIPASQVYRAGELLWANRLPAPPEFSSAHLYWMMQVNGSIEWGVAVGLYVGPQQDAPAGVVIARPEIGQPTDVLTLLAAESNFAKDDTLPELLAYAKELAAAKGKRIMRKTVVTTWEPV